MCDNCAEARKTADNISEQMKTSERVREFYRRQGECRERERIIKILESTPFIWMGDKQFIQVSRDDLIELIKGGNK